MEKYIILRHYIKHYIKTNYKNNNDKIKYKNIIINTKI